VIATDQVRGVLQQHTSHLTDGVSERAEMLPSERGAVFSVSVRSADPSVGSVGLVVCPSWFELRMLQRAEFELLRAAARVGVCGRYVQAAGSGDSDGSPEACTIAARIDAALLAAEQLRRDVPEVRTVVYAGARLGGAIAALASARDGHDTALLLWDPSFDADEYWRQSRRFARVVGALGRNRVEDADSLLSRGEPAFVIGYLVTAELRQDLTAIGSAGRLGRVADQAFVAALNDASLVHQRRSLARLATHVEAVRLGPPKARNLIRLRIEDAHRAIEPSVSWLQGLG
jgi:hypothetical protein